LFSLGAQGLSYEVFNEKCDKLNTFINHFLNIQNTQNSHIKDPKILFTIQERECRYFTLNDFDLSQPLVFDSILKEGEILLNVRNFIIKGETFSAAILPYREEYVLLKEIPNKSNDFYVMEDKKHFFKYTQNLSKEELQLSMYISAPRFRYGSDGDIDEELNQKYLRIQEIAGEIILNIQDNQEYNIYTNHWEASFDTLVAVEGRYLKEIHKYNVKTYLNQEKVFKHFSLIKSIACNDNIPYVLKDNIVRNYLWQYFEVNTDYEAAKGELLDFLLKLIKNYPQIPDNQDEHSSEIDQEAMDKVIREYCHQETITSSDLYNFSCEVIKIDKNPRVTLLAYSGITHYYLDQDNLEEAIVTADSALMKYDHTISWVYFKECCHLNSVSAMMCINYLFQNGTEPAEIFKVIDHFSNISTYLPEFQNFLNYERAELTNAMALPYDDVISAYKKVNTDMEIEYVFSGGGNYASGEKYAGNAANIIKQLEEEKVKLVKVSTPITIKKYLFSDNAEMINENGEMMIIILPSDPVQGFGERPLYKYLDWQKAEIVGEIYWIQIADY
jgi:hypothetical protein